MRKICEWIARRLPLRRISINGDDYLLRYYVCGRLPRLHWPGVRPWLGWLPASIYLHCFLRPDQDRDLHNHPWDRALAVVLSGGYLEERLDAERIVERRLRAPAVNVIRRDDFHRIVTLDQAEVWTLFVAGRKVGSWGYRDRETGAFRRHRAEPRPSQYPGVQHEPSD